MIAWTTLFLNQLCVVKINLKIQWERNILGTMTRPSSLLIDTWKMLMTAWGNSMVTWQQWFSFHKFIKPISFFFFFAYFHILFSSTILKTNWASQHCYVMLGSKGVNLAIRPRARKPCLVYTLQSVCSCNAV